jgi:hypothetical protein
LGELLQADAAPFDWFGNGERLALHGFIDDAAGTITALYLCKNEYLTGQQFYIYHKFYRKFGRISGASAGNRALRGSASLHSLRFTQRTL